MRASRERILTTHVGSLPRPADLVALLVKKERGEPHDPALFERTARAAVAAAVARQAAVGIDVVSDGELAKIGYSTYIQDRLSGFGGDNPRKPALDLAAYPDLRKKLAAIMGTQQFKRASCIGPIAIKDRAPLARDLDNLRAALGDRHDVEGFMNAASPGLVTAFQPNEFYASHREYLEAVGVAMREEFEAIVAAGFVLQVDCPDLAMARHTGFQDLSESDFLKRAAEHVEVLDAALANIPADRVRMHICWGNYEGPHEFDIDLAKVIDIVLRAKPQAISFEGANPRHEHEWIVWRDARIPGDKILMPGVLDSTSNYVEHPELVAQRIERYAAIVGRERVIASSDCGFGTFAGYSKVDPEIAYKKLAAMVEGARIASGRLFS